LYNIFVIHLAMALPKLRHLCKRNSPNCNNGTPKKEISSNKMLS